MSQRESGYERQEYDPVKAAEQRRNARLNTLDRIAKAMAEKAGEGDWNINEETRKRWTVIAKSGLEVLRDECGTGSTAGALLTVVLAQSPTDTGSVT